MSKFKSLLTLFLTFFKIGAFTFGGGYAMIPLIEAEVQEKHNWITKDDVLEIFAIAESTPGPIAINSATFIGYKVCGVAGSVFATLGVVLPSFIIITIIAFVLQEFQSLKVVQYAFFGIRAGVLALIVKAFISMYKKVKKSAFAYFIAAASFLIAVFVDINLIYVIIGCAISGLIYTFATLKSGKEDKK